MLSSSTAQTESAASIKFDQANEYFITGDYSEAIRIYDDILEEFPSSASTLKMKGIALSNQGQHTLSLRQFYKVLQTSPNDIISLTGIGVGFGYLGEYHEAKTYFEKALELRPSSIVLQNYKEYVDKVIAKYPYTPTEKPEPVVKTKVTKIPDWVKNNAGWWADGQINDTDFVSGINFLINNEIMQIPQSKTQEQTGEKIPGWVKDTAKWWAQGQINDTDFVLGIQFLIERGIIVIKIEPDAETIKKELEDDFRNFEFYLTKIANNVAKEKRYIEYPNPSEDVIKKFLRDYIKWNFDDEAKSASKNFPDPTYEIINDVNVIYYKIFINEQPTGLPLDHVSTLENSIKFWEEQELSINNEKARIKSEFTNQKSEANVWVTWIVRDLGQGVLGHAHLGKGIVEVTLGDYECDGSFQLYNVASVEKIMTHELGHSIGLGHTEDPSNIMYPSLKPSYAYCLLR